MHGHIAKPERVSLRDLLSASVSMALENVKGKEERKKTGGVQKKTAQQGTAAAEKKEPKARDKIRLLQHLLKNQELAPAARTRAQAELDALMAGKAEVHKKEQERKLATRYHKVRFFERVKIERHIKHLEREGAQAGGLAAADEAQLAQWRADLQYVRHFPSGEKYVSLLRTADSPEAQAKLDQERGRLRALVSAQLAAAAEAAATVAALTEADEGLGALHMGVGAALKITSSGQCGAMAKEGAVAKQGAVAAAGKGKAGVAAGGKATGAGAQATNPGAAEAGKSAPAPAKPVTEAAIKHTVGAEGAGAAGVQGEPEGSDDFFLSGSEGEEQGEQSALPRQPVVAGTALWALPAGFTEPESSSEDEGGGAGTGLTMPKQTGQGVGIGAGAGRAQPRVAIASPHAAKAETGRGRRVAVIREPLPSGHEGQQQREAAGALGRGSQGQGQKRVAHAQQEEQPEKKRRKRRGIKKGKAAEA